MKIAITGASGFLGSYVLYELEKLNIDIFATIRAAAPPNYLKKTNIHWVNLDINSLPEECFKAIGEPDALIHLAWGGLPNYDSLHHFENELPHQYKFLSTLIREGLKSLIVVGTCFEYGSQSGPIDSNTQTNPTNPYGLAKDSLHKQLQQLKKLHPFKLTWARLFYMYGLRQSKNSLYSSLRRAVDSGDKVFKMSGGEQVRDYLPVENVASSIVKLALNQNDRDVLNICSGKPVTIRALVEGWIEENGWHIELALGEHPYSKFEPFSFWGLK